MTSINQPYISIQSGDNGLGVAVPDSITDNRAIIQSYIDWVESNWGCGFVFIPPGIGGHYKNSAPLVIKKGVTLFGVNKQSSVISSFGDNTVVHLDPTATHGGLRDLFVIGYQNAAATQPAVSVGINVPVILSNCSIWGGNWALNIAGNDGTISNCDIMGYGSGGGVLSTGANWYERVKMDSMFNSLAAFAQNASPTPGVAENHLTDCDFSGPYTASVWIDDGGTHQAITVFTGGVFSSPIQIYSAKNTSFAVPELGSTTFNHASGSLSVVGGTAFNPTIVSGGGSPRAGNGTTINLSL